MIFSLRVNPLQQLTQAVRHLPQTRPPHALVGMKPGPLGAILPGPLRYSYIPTHNVTQASQFSNVSNLKSLALPPAKLPSTPDLLTDLFHRKDISLLMVHGTSLPDASCIIKGLNNTLYVGVINLKHLRDQHQSVEMFSAALKEDTTLSDCALYAQHAVQGTDHPCAFVIFNNAQVLFDDHTRQNYIFPFLGDPDVKNNLLGIYDLNLCKMDPIPDAKPTRKSGTTLLKTIPFYYTMMVGQLTVGYWLFQGIAKIAEALK